MATTYFQTFLNAFASVEMRSRLLDGDQILCPPSEDFGYQSTPVNAVTFASMGVDGVHYAILKIDDQVRDDSPVVQVSPMDSDDITILAGSFLSFLADGCGISKKEMQTLLDDECAGRPQLVSFLEKNFDSYRLLGVQRTHRLASLHGHSVVRKTQLT